MIDGICGEIGNTAEILLKEINEMIVEPLMKEDEERIKDYLGCLHEAPGYDISNIVMVSNYEPIGELFLKSLEFENKVLKIKVNGGWWIEFCEVKTPDHDRDGFTWPCFIVTDGVVRNYFIVSLSY